MSDAAEISQRLRGIEDKLGMLVRMEERQIGQGDAIKRAHKRCDALEASDKECQAWRNKRDGAAFLTGRFAAPLWAAVASAITAYLTGYW